MKRVLITIARWLGRFVLVVAVVVFFLVAVFDMRLEFDGGSRPQFVFGDTTDHYADLEADRLEQSSTPMTRAPSPSVETADRSSRIPLEITPVA